MRNPFAMITGIMTLPALAQQRTTYDDGIIQRLSVLIPYACLLMGLLPVKLSAQFVTPGVVSPSSQTITSGTVPAALSATAPSGGSGDYPYTYTFQWQSSANGSSWTNITGATSGSSYAPGALTATTYFHLLTYENGSAYVSNKTTVTVSALALQPGSLSPTGVSINYNTSPGQLTGTAATGGDGSYSYQWQSSPDNVNWTNISGATAQNYTPGNLTVTTYFRRLVTSNGVTVQSNVVTLTVYPQLIAGSLQPGSKSISPNTSPGPLGGATVSGGNGSYTYQWQTSSDNSTWTTISGTTAQNYTPGNLATATWYRRQVTSNGITAFSEPVVISMIQPVAALPAAYSNTTVNYIRSYEATAPDTSDAGLLSRPLRDVKQTTQYFDGLGRPIQIVVKQGSYPTGGSAADLVNPVVYDEWGRVQRQYLPFAANTTGGNTSVSDGAFKPNPFQQQASFMAAQFPGEDHYYSQTVFEASPLSRVQKQMAPGNNWAGSDRGIENKFYINTAADSVRIWAVTNIANEWASYGTTAAYTAGELYKNMTVDEHGKQVVEFKDKEGQVVLKKAQLTAPADNGGGSGHAGWLCTYYVYDDLNNLRLIIQPKGVELLLTAGWPSPSTGGGWGEALNELCFRYEYDGRRRRICQKAPGAGEVSMVYDQWDRLVLTQDTNMRIQNKWLFTKYDGLNRPIMTGFYTNTTHTTQSSMQAFLNSQNLGRYENYTPAGSLPMYSLTQSFPVVSYSDVLTVTYYDDYAWTSGVAADYRNFDNSFSPHFATSGFTTWPYPQPVQASAATHSMVTGTITKTADGSTVLVSTSFYDDKGRILQTKAQNISGGCDITTTQYSFSGQPLVTVVRQQKNGANPQTHTIITKMDYDDLGRLLTVRKAINSTINGQTINKPQQVIVSNEYDALGQLKKKTLAPSSGSAGGGGLDSLIYDHNIRGWLLGANRTYAKDSNSTAHHFGFELAYDKNDLSVNDAPDPYAATQFNGNIAGMLWKSSGDSRVRRYDFTYDAVNRLTGAHFKQFTGSSFNLNAGMDFSTSGLTYDANGNILTLNQQGWKPGGSTMMDNLFYTYYNNGNSNRLQNVVDKVNDAQTRLGDFRSSSIYMTTLGNKTVAAVDYTYDANGNLKKDLNKDIGTTTTEDILYNHLNLPQTITMRKEGGAVKGTITYTYDAAGNKLRKLVQETGRPDRTTLYTGGAIYENDSLQFISHEEGRLRYVKRKFTNGDSAYQFQYDYFLKDHLGNVRMVLTEQTDTTQYLASMETAYRTREEQLFYNILQTVIAKDSIAGYPTDPNPVTNPNDLVAKVNGSGNKVGPAIVLKVMSGDKVDVAVKSFYKSGGTAGNNNDPVTDILTSLASGIVGVAGESKGALTDLSGGSSPLVGALNSFRSGNNPDQPTNPKAYLNWILLDEQLKYVLAGSGSDPVKTADAIQPLSTPGELTIPKNGFLYIYVSNETQNWDVFFDNLSIQHTTGPITEETHYYPFGLTMAGISSKAMGKLSNKYKFNGIEHNADFDLNMYEARFRNLDPQIGRFWQVDPKPNESISPFVAMENNPLRYADPLGDTIIIRYTDNTAHKSEVVYSKGAVSPRNGGDVVMLDNTSEYMSNVVGDLNTIKTSNDKELNKRLTTLENSEQIHVIEMPDLGQKNGNVPNSSADDKEGIPTGSTTKYNPEDYQNARGEVRKPVIGLGHELLGHGYDSDQGKSNYDKTSNGIPMYEVSGVNVENRVRASVGAPKKTTYGGKPIRENLLDDTHNKKKR